MMQAADVCLGLKGLSSLGAGLGAMLGGLSPHLTGQMGRGGLGWEEGGNGRNHESHIDMGSEYQVQKRCKYG